MVQLVTHVNFLALIYKNPHGKIESPGHIAELTDPHQQYSLCTEYLEIVECGIHHPVVAFFIDGHAFGTGKFSRAIALASEPPDKLEVGSKDLHGAASRVCDGEIPVRADGDAYGKVELAILLTPLAEMLFQLKSVQVEDQHLVQVGIHHIKTAAAFINRHEGGVLDSIFSADGGHEMSGFIKLQDHVLQRVRNEDVIGSVNHDAERRLQDDA